MAARGNEFLRNDLCHVVSSETKPLASPEHNFYAYVKNAVFF
jgi:hypothetical protein